MNIHNTKSILIEALLETYDSIMVVVQRSMSGVVLPEHLTNALVGLNIGYRLIADLKTDTHGITCTLTFNGVGFHCTLPWQAVDRVVIPGGQIVWVADEAAVSKKALPVKQHLPKKESPTEQHLLKKASPVNKGLHLIKGGKKD